MRSGIVRVPLNETAVNVARYKKHRTSGTRGFSFCCGIGREREKDRGLGKLISEWIKR